MCVLPDFRIGERIHFSFVSNNERMKSFHNPSNIPVKLVDEEGIDHFGLSGDNNCNDEFQIQFFAMDLQSRITLC